MSTRMCYSTPTALGEKARSLEPEKAPGASEALKGLLRAPLQMLNPQLEQLWALLEPLPATLEPHLGDGEFFIFLRFDLLPHFPGT